MVKERKERETCKKSSNGAFAAFTPAGVNSEHITHTHKDKQHTHVQEMG